VTLSFAVSERFRDAAAEWGDSRLVAEAEALETKTEQALLEIEHLVSGATEVAFTVDGDVVRYDPSDELAALLEAQAESTGVAPETVLRLHVDLFARAFLDEDHSAPGHHPDDPRP
jgi:hypothetical protein